MVADLEELNRCRLSPEGMQRLAAASEESRRLRRNREILSIFSYPHTVFTPCHRDEANNSNHW